MYLYAPVPYATDRDDYSHQIPTLSCIKMHSGKKPNRVRLHTIFVDLFQNIGMINLLFYELQLQK
jgi:hypothetical protein